MNTLYVTFELVSVTSMMKKKIKHFEFLDYLTDGA